ncbi:P-loop containing nucleoside triphosphate hydrolase protein [Nemania serpens]|nr:P-loop containing nucleoside triphosphate hydrolase protein [Nemania serpens]
MSTETPTETTTTTTTTSTKKKKGFVPREVFEVSGQIAKSYFIGHHRKALHEMGKVLANIGLVIECRDSRVPLSSRSRVLETALATRERVIVYTKAHLSTPKQTWPTKAEELLARWQGTWDEMDAARTTKTSDVLFTDVEDPRSIARLIDVLKARAAAHNSILGLRAFIVGLPNAGKSALLNALRNAGMQNATKAARTGAQVGVTRKVSQPVRIIPATPPPSSSLDDDSAHGSGGNADALDVGEGVFVVDTPGVFHSYIQEPETMLKLALVGSVKDWIVPAEIVVDYLLFRLNLLDPSLYAHLCAEPTNDVDAFLTAVALRTGKLVKGGGPSLVGAAVWVVKQWRDGLLGRFCLDDLTPDALDAVLEKVDAKREEKLSLSQARKRDKEARKLLHLARKKKDAELFEMRQALAAEVEAETRGGSGSGR